jgi:hypothetical protein
VSTTTSELRRRLRITISLSLHRKTVAEAHPWR